MPSTDSSSADSRAHDAAILALTLYSEAGDRPLRAIEALAALVMNRHRSGQGHWGQGITGICRAPFQFPCWNTRHPHHARLRAAAPGPAMSAAAAFEEFGAPLLVTTADHALLTPAMVAHLLREAPGRASAVAALARRDTILAEFPETRRTWLRFRDGDFSGCNLFLLARPEAIRVLRFWQRLEQQRKRPTAMARMLGPIVLLRYALGWMTLRAGLDALGARCGTPVAVVEMPFGAAAVDVDKPDDLALVEARLGGAERRRLPQVG
ncbi:hypothetical protein [Roseomonas sp. TAS13]|uniref:hypothetical protein n=2 Tax=unclassified Roseomonas TaxID=2617492 RepID=UPI00209B0C4D|nr:hypothetical protein [Roseomonas sp. TAS13]